MIVVGDSTPLQSTRAPSPIPPPSHRPSHAPGARRNSSTPPRTPSPPASPAQLPPPSAPNPEASRSSIRDPWQAQKGCELSSVRDGRRLSKVRLRRHLRIARGRVYPLTIINRLRPPPLPGLHSLLEREQDRRCLLAPRRLVSDRQRVGISEHLQFIHFNCLIDTVEGSLVSLSVSYATRTLLHYFDQRQMSSDR